MLRVLLGTNHAVTGAALTGEKVAASRANTASSFMSKTSEFVPASADMIEPVRRNDDSDVLLLGLVHDGSNAGQI